MAQTPGAFTLGRMPLNKPVMTLGLVYDLTTILDIARINEDADTNEDYHKFRLHVDYERIAGEPNNVSNLTIDLSDRTSSTCTFEKFKELPSDVRRKIWNMALPGPRVVKIHAKDNLNSATRALATSIPNCANGELTFVSSDPPPTILFVCRESREEAQKSYDLTFGCRYLLVRHQQHGFQRWKSPNTVWFNFALDTLCFEGNSFSGQAMFNLYGFTLDLYSPHIAIRAGTNRVERITFDSAVGVCLGYNDIQTWVKMISYFRYEGFLALKEINIMADAARVSDWKYVITNPRLYNSEVERWKVPEIWFPEFELDDE